MDHENDEVCLELGLGERIPKRDHSRKNKRFFFLDLSIPIHSSDRIISAGSSSSLKILGEDEKEGSKNSFSSGSKDDDDNNCSKNFSRKKLRLTRDQTTLLEDSFRQHTTLNMVYI
ncbi:hypothetical protein CDL12_29194 [Handroanthus impetiginosus]|uniref:Homeobox domain-containing protein n=1 Tax=Handroanthus impetiginosus TaxID=429701 RepID=A0A2G9FZ29_9LAMI|nr:hypothetical protein CDL12_29194 [Handroanthus impetiginosus]